jgi:hypothetical protein
MLLEWHQAHVRAWLSRGVLAPERSVRGGAAQHRIATHRHVRASRPDLAAKALSPPEEPLREGSSALLSADDHVRHGQSQVVRRAVEA